MTKEERSAYMKAYRKSPNGRAQQKERTKKLNEFMKTHSFKFNARNYILHTEKQAKLPRKVGALAERLPNHYRQDGRIQYI